MNKHEFANVQSEDKILLINPDYQCNISDEDLKMEHLLSCLLLAIAVYVEFDSAIRIKRLFAKLRKNCDAQCIKAVIKRTLSK